MTTADRRPVTTERGEPGLLLLHGFMGRGSDWGAVVGGLDAGLRVLAPDLPGHGTALGLPEAAYTMDGVVGRLAARLDAEGIGRAIVAGYSMGGRLALHLALRFPGCVAGLVLVSASPGLRTEEERAERRALDAQRAASLATDLPGFLHDWYRMPLWNGLTDGQRERLIQRRTQNDPLELARSLGGMGTGAQTSHWEQLRALRVPAQIVVGARDAKYVAIAQAMTALGPFQAHTVPDASHALLQEAPHAVASVLNEASTHALAQSPNHEIPDGSPH